jgi:hypothetical protein
MYNAQMGALLAANSVIKEIVVFVNQVCSLFSLIKLPS